MSGKNIRLARLFGNDGRALIVALDHGRRHGPIPGIKNLGKTLKEIVKAEVDGIMMTPAMISRYWDIVKDIFLIARIDGTGTVKSLDETDDRLIASVLFAVKKGADAVSVMVYPGSINEQFLWEKLSIVVEEAENIGIPVLAEVVPKPPVFENKFDPYAIAYGSRIAAEIGADIIKTLYTENFGEIVESTPVPIVILGGEKTSSPTDILEIVEKAVKEGAAGAAIGRNIFQHENPLGMARALMAIIHEGLKASEAAESFL
ncbi:MAG: fructose-bisphosphate aldolase [Thermoprotei archaeon]|nr:MAG: fructose-bisphosphate aldolase [Thermoprotei archaeon]